MNKAALTTVGSILSALLASLCCIGPVVFALIGAGSLGFAAMFEPYRPYLLALTVLFLGAAFYFTYRKREVKCEDGTCRTETAGKWNKLLLWIAATVVAIFMFFPQILTLL
ncbi:MAG: mercuric transporter MerT family protein [bacterium]